MVHSRAGGREVLCLHHVCTVNFEQALQIGDSFVPALGCDVFLSALQEHPRRARCGDREATDFLRQIRLLGASGREDGRAKERQTGPAAQRCVRVVVESVHGVCCRCSLDQFEALAQDPLAGK